MSAAEIDRLVYMANQIARFFEAQPAEAAALTADHLESFWAPRMRQMLAQHVAAGGPGLSPIADEAARRLRTPRAARRGSAAAVTPDATD